MNTGVWPNVMTMKAFVVLRTQKQQVWRKVLHAEFSKAFQTV
jgi:hypothetical protein